MTNAIIDPYKDNYQAALLKIDALEAENRELKRRLGENVGEKDEDSLVKELLIVVPKISLPEDFKGKLARQRKITQAKIAEEDNKEKREKQIQRDRDKEEKRIQRDRDKEEKRRYKELSSVFWKIIKQFRKNVVKLQVQKALYRKESVLLFNIEPYRFGANLTLKADGFFWNDRKLVRILPGDDGQEVKWSGLIKEFITRNVNPDEFAREIEKNLIEYFVGKMGK